MFRAFWGSKRGVFKGSRGSPFCVFKVAGVWRVLSGFAWFWAVLEGFGGFCAVLAAPMGPQAPPRRATNLRLEGFF